MAARGRQRRAAGMAYTTTTPVRNELAKKADGYSTSGLTKENYPLAISHDRVFHDTLQAHIDELHSRFHASAPETKQKTEWHAMAGRFDAHINAARQELANSLEAHKHGFADRNADGTPSAVSFHTANESYRRAATHLADAHKFILSEQGAGPKLARDSRTGEAITDESGAPKFRRQGISKLGYQILKDDSPVAEHPLPTAGQLSGLVNDYQNHVRNQAIKNNVVLPKGVADRAPVKFELQGEPSAEARSAVGSRGFPLTAEEEIKNKFASRTAAAARNTARVQERQQRRGQTFTVDESGKRGLENNKNPYAGVGFTGHATLVRAVAQHFAKTYPGQEFIGSEAHRDPISYASKHEVELPSQESMIGKTLRMTGERQISASAVTSETRDTDPSQRGKPIKPSGRTASFQQGHGGSN